MRNILKGFLEPQAEKYILPDASDIQFEEGISDFQFPSLDDEEAPLPRRSPYRRSWMSPSERRSPERRSLSRYRKKEKPKEPETPVHYAQLQAELILNKAREEAEALLAQAREQAQSEIEEIRAGARDEGYRDGYAQGTAKAMSDAVRDREATAARLEKEVQAFLEKASLAREEMILQSRDELVELCLAVAEKVVRVSLKSSSEVIVRMIQTATERMKRQEWVHIYISGCDVRQLSKISPALTTTLGALSQHIKIIPMGDGEDGTCIVETPDEIVDASVSTQMSNVRDVIRDQMGVQWPQ